ncbi:MAG: hypothetical protein ACK5NN_01495 [Sphingomonadaceae bacterium]
MADNFVLALPASLDRAQATQVYNDLMNLVSNEAETDDRIIIYDAGNQSLIADMHVPSDGSESIRNRRLRAMSHGVEAFGGFVKDHYISQPTEDPANQNIYLPQLLNELSTQTLANMNREASRSCVLIIGNAQYDDRREEGFSMTGGYFPSDGFIVGSQTQSPFGTADKQGFLTGMNVHFVYTDDSWASDVHLLRTYRTWSLFVRAQGGVLSTFTPDIATAMDRWKSCDIKPGRSFSYDSTRDIQAMIEWTRAPAPDENTSSEEAVTTGEPSAALLANDDWLRRENINRSDEPPTSQSGSMKLGIRWGDQQSCGGVDMDLYTRTTPSYDYLFFNNKTTVDGRFNKDITDASQLGMSNGMEYVDLFDVQDLSQLEIMVNHYAGQCDGGVEGVVRAYFNGIVYEQPFAVQSSSGNSGGQRGQAENSEYWTIVDPKRLFNLTSTEGR